MQFLHQIRRNAGRTAVGLALVGALGPIAVAHAAGDPTAADNAAISYVDSTYPGSGQASVLKTEADIEHGVAVYDVRTLAPNGTVYVLHVRQSDNTVLSVSGAEGQTGVATTSTDHEASGTSPDQPGATGSVDDKGNADATQATPSPETAQTTASTPSGSVDAAFTPFWVEAFTPTVGLWSGTNAQAVRLGEQGQWSAFEVVQPQAGPRLFIYNPTTGGYAYVNASEVGPTGAPA